MTESRHIKRIVPFSSDKHPNDQEDHMAPNSASVSYQGATDASVTPASPGAQATASGAAYLISFLWVAGYLFLSEKRHVIVKTAYYISSQLEARHPGLGWERWHLGAAEGRTFWRWDP